MVLIIFFALVSGAFVLAKCILFTSFESGGQMFIITEEVDKSMIDGISENDAIFDTVTKRKIGTVQMLKILEEKDKIRFLISTDAKYFPRSKSLRTKNLWFEYTAASKEIFEQYALSEDK